MIVELIVMGVALFFGIVLGIRRFRRKKKQKKEVSDSPQPTKPKKSKLPEWEQEFEKGNIVLPTDLRDYANYKEFKKNTSHLPRIQQRLKQIEVHNGIKSS